MSFLRLCLMMLLLGVAAHACPGCKVLPAEGVVSHEAVQQQKRANEGFSWSVIFMLTVPMGLVASAGVFVVRTCREVDARHQGRD
jgi:hypothetical protein